MIFDKRNGFLKIKSLTFRFLAILLLAIPAFIPVAKNNYIQNLFPNTIPTPLIQLCIFLIYTVLIYFSVLITFGINGLTKLLSIATVLALVVCLTQAITPHIPIIGTLLIGTKSVESLQAASLAQFINMMTVIPLGLFCVYCFPASEIISKIKLKSGRVPEYIVYIAIVLRLFIIVIEGIATFKRAWWEENPKIILPRFMAEVSSTQKLWKFPVWFIGAGKTWAFALIIYTLEQIPALIHHLDLTLLENKGDINVDK
jgi:hypothetical protein